MSRRTKGPRLWLERGGRWADGSVRQAVWCIRDGRIKRRTGFGPSQAEEAQIALADYILAKAAAPRERDRSPAQIEIADVISVYADDVLHNHARPQETAARLDRVLDFFGQRTLSYLNQKTCAAYVAHRMASGKGVQAARRELEDLRAAVRHHWKQGYCSVPVPVVLPERSASRDRWLTRAEAARLLKAAWRLRQPWRGQPSDRPTAQHVARFILVALYTGTRAAAICSAALTPTAGAGFIDLDNGVFYRRPHGRRQTKKRQPPVRLPPRLHAHLRRWARLGIAVRAVVEWNGEPVKRINKAFRSVRAAAALGPDVTPHTLRHTCATWLAQAGTPIWEAAGFLGMTTEMFDLVYGHHHPDHLSTAVNALSGRRGQLADRMSATEREQTEANVVKLHGKR
jgi:integrase